MCIELVSPSNYNQFNVKLAQILGLDSAVYISEILNIKAKAISKNKMVEGYIKLDRNYIKNRTSLELDHQLKIDRNLAKINLVETNPENLDLIKFDEGILYDIFKSDDYTKRSLNKLKVKTNIEVRETKKQAIINNLKDSIFCSNNELLAALRDWVDAIYSSPNGFLSKKAIKLFQEDLNNYTKGDLDLALKIVNIATVQGYKICQYAINVYERERNKEQNSVRITNQLSVNDVGVSEDFF